MTHRTCSVDGCDKKHKGHGYCEMHLDRWKKHGTTDALERESRECYVSGCDRPRISASLCELHHDRLKRTGDIHLKPKQREFIELHSDALHDDCIEWPYNRNASGYGKVDQTTAHRLMCQRAHGPAPDGKSKALHSCANRACINPNHLRWGTTAENQQDMVEHGNSLQGVKHHKAKLNDDKVREIRAKRSTHSLSELSKQYGVSKTVLSKIQRRRLWKHVE